MSQTLLQRVAAIEAALFGPLPIEAGQPVPVGGVLQVASADGAITVSSGLVVVTKTSLAALTKAAPVSGAPANGGDDGKPLRLYSRTAYAHTITFPSGVLAGGFTIISFEGNIGDTVEIQAYQGTYQVNGGNGYQLS